MDRLKVSLVQIPLVWESPQANRDNIEQLLNTQPDFSSDLVLLPETFTTGFTNNGEEFSETMVGNTVSWMKSLSSSLGTTLAGSLLIRSEGKLFNRFVFAAPDGQISFYDKKHLFTLAKEHKHYSPGNERKIIEIKGWRIFPQVCYDLRFPIWSRNNLNYDLLIYVANWPRPRINAWECLLSARAIENQAYVCGVNRIGTDDNGIEYTGSSRVIDYAGEILEDLENQQGIKTIVLEKNPMLHFRKKLDFLADQDAFTLPN